MSIFFVPVVYLMLMELTDLANTVHNVGKVSLAHIVLGTSSTTRVLSVVCRFRYIPIRTSSESCVVSSI
jgi:hypothetical protein